jgi:hypothetical protein
MRARALAAVAAAALVAGCGSAEGGGRSGALLWSEGPHEASSALLPGDRIVGGKIRNDSLRVMNLAARDVRLVDEDGRRVQADVTFQYAPGHTLWPTGRVDVRLLPESEQRRLGMRAKLKPGEEAPFVVAWRAKDAGKPPVRADYGTGSLPLAVPLR